MTDRDAPKLQWRLDGASLPKLGQSWSTPIADAHQHSGAAYDVTNTDKSVLVIGGGYEPDQDKRLSTTDSIGNAIYIVDAINGNLLWHASNSGAMQNFATTGRAMDYSIPARIRVVDFDGDGFADRFYAGDMGGQLWRFDVSNGQPASSLVAGGVIAQLGAAPSTTPTQDTIRRSTTRRTSPRSTPEPRTSSTSASARAIAAIRSVSATTIASTRCATIGSAR